MFKIKLISKKEFNKLLDEGIIKNECYFGNHTMRAVDWGWYSDGKYSSGFFDGKTNNHIGVTITKNKIYIEDSYVK